MAATPSTRLLAAMRWSQALASRTITTTATTRHAAPARRQTIQAARPYSSTTDDAPPPFLQKLKADLKTAMRAKDAPRLAVLRAIMSANLNASKTATPIRTDVQLVALIRKIQKSALDSAADARAAGRQDLVDKEEEQARILDAYLADSGVRTLGEAELRALVQDAVDASKQAGTAAKSLMGDVMKRLAGALEGKDVDRKQVASLVKELTGQ
ncbi:Aspartyl/glutamyl-tRNA amidotransferase subunit B-related protein [Purpureocillium lavendulum]|uniref:Altered inheritance of mitochondria protein 41 n=1 Tax=Purpureocillium lavendulum TaxID=1247861 RepID=A0AB34G6W5_9HYPO|nr:Aspartyl/glutamyl-tRNA amidotransferase subunit B-related protein [Purpureocillium lavendulum]